MLGDKKKFENARLLETYVPTLSENIKIDSKSASNSIKQRAAILYLTLRLGIRPGQNQETYGCCTLLVKHIKFLSNNCIILNFIGKKNVVYKTKIFIESYIYVNLETFVYKKKSNEKIFNETKATQINKYLKNEISNGVTLKTIRTYKACVVFLDEIEVRRHERNKLDVIKSAFNKVQKMCNHKTKITGRKYYIDPRIVFALIDQYKLLASRIYSDSLLKKFAWAKNTKMSFRWR